MGKVTGRRLHKLEWAAHDAAVYPLWAAMAAKAGIPWAVARAAVRPSTVLAMLGLWRRYEQQEAARAGYPVAEVRQDAARRGANMASPRGGQTDAI